MIIWPAHAQTQKLQFSSDMTPMLFPIYKQMHTTGGEKKQQQQNLEHPSCENMPVAYLKM